MPPTNGTYSRSGTNQAFAAAEEILRNRGDQPRRKQNRLTFPAPDDDVVSRLKEQGRIFPVRQSIAAWMVGPGFLTSPVSAGDSRFPRGMPAAAAASAFYPTPPRPNILSVAWAPEVAGTTCLGPHRKSPTRVPPLWLAVPKLERIAPRLTEPHPSTNIILRHLRYSNVPHGFFSMATARRRKLLSASSCLSSSARNPWMSRKCLPERDIIQCPPPMDSFGSSVLLTAVISKGTIFTVAPDPLKCS